MKCPECGSERVHYEKYSGDGRDHRSYQCMECGWKKEEDGGVATWKVMVVC